MLRTNTILYVADQKRSTALYAKILAAKPQLEVAGMTEFQLSTHHVLGLMPEAGIKRLLGSGLPDPQKASGIPRAEIYFSIPDPEIYQKRALEAGCRELSPILPRDWGDRAGYVIDPDGHVLAFAAVQV